MANLSSNTNLTIPRGAVVKFGLGGIGQAIDESGTYKLGNQEVILGPYPVAKTITVLVQSTVRYVIDTDGVVGGPAEIDPIGQRFEDPDFDKSVRTMTTQVADSRQFLTRFTVALANTFGSPKTYAQRMQVPFAFLGGRVVQYNRGAAPAANTVQYAVGTVADTTSQASGFVSVTWNSATSAGGGAVFKNPVSSPLLEMALSDPFALTSIARTDGGSGHLVELRSVVNGTVFYSQSVGPTAGVQRATVEDTDFALEANGDFVTTNQSGFGTPAVIANGNVRIGDLILFTTDAVYTVGVGGDSIAYGQYGRLGLENEFLLAANQLTVDGVANITAGHAATPGAVAATFAFKAVEYITKIKPNVFVYTPISPNTGTPSVQSNIDIARARLMMVVEAARMNNTKLILCSSSVWNPWGAASAANVAAFNVWLEDFCSKIGAVFFDRYTLTSNGANPPQLKAGYGYPTGTADEQAHLDVDGYTALMPEAALALRAALGV